MDFNLDDEQRALKEMTRGLLGQSYSDYENRRSVVGADPGYDPKMWLRLGEHGLLGLPVAEEYGGSDVGLIEAAVVAREFGRVLAPEPFIEAVVATLLIAEVGTEEQRHALLPTTCAGESLLVLAVHEVASQWGLVATDVSAALSDNQWTVTGSKEPVPFGDQADDLVVTARLPGGGTGLFVVSGQADGLTRHGYQTTAGGRAARIEFDHTPVEPLGDAGLDQIPAIQRAASVARVLAAHEALGAMETALTMTCTYLTQRQQFGRTLNHFQALTFRAADMYVELELAESMAAWAVMVVAEGGVNSDDAADRAAAQIARASRHIANEAIQLHGGIGMTAEHPIGGYAQRLTAFQQAYGTRERHLVELARRVDQYEVIDPLEVRSR